MTDLPDPQLSRFVCRRSCKRHANRCKLVFSTFSRKSRSMKSPVSTPRRFLFLAKAKLLLLLLRPCTVDLLRYNDEFNNSFKTFESYMQERERRVGPTPNFVKDRTASPTKTSLPTSQSSVNKVQHFPRFPFSSRAILPLRRHPLPQEVKTMNPL